MFKAFTDENWTAKSQKNSKNKLTLYFRISHKNLKNVIYNLWCETMSKLSVMYVVFLIFAYFTPGKQLHFLDQRDYHPRIAVRLRLLMNFTTLDFANAFLSPGVNSRAELVPSPRVRTTRYACA